MSERHCLCVTGYREPQAICAREDTTKMHSAKSAPKLGIRRFCNNLLQYNIVVVSFLRNLRGGCLPRSPALRYASCRAEILRSCRTCLLWKFCVPAPGSSALHYAPCRAEILRFCRPCFCCDNSTFSAMLRCGWCGLFL